MAAPDPKKIGKYDVLGVIGRGGMGVVYQGKDLLLDRLVAIKMITGVLAEQPDMHKRFFREAQSLGSLQHRNIVTVFDLGDYDGNPYLVMEYLEGECLDHVMSSGRELSLLEKLSVVIQVCRGLNYAHRRGVVHRDIKPANIMLGKDGGVKIFDFGIAHVGNRNVTRTGQVLGTLKYMAPEQFNSKSADSRTDIFSTGVVLYQLLTRHLPFEAENTASTMLKIVNEPPPPLGSFLSAFPPEMEQILLRALAKNPEDRYNSAEEFALDLEQLQGELKEELIEQELHEAAVLLDREELQKAQACLVRVLKVDQHNTQANRQLREAQKRIQREEIGKQVRDLGQHAEDALAAEQFEEALEHADRALGLDRNNLDLKQLRERICAAASRAEKLHNALKIAETAHTEGRLDEAREAAEAALAVAPANTLARTLYRLITREIEARSRQLQVEGYLQEARSEIAARRFTAALEILKRAEELDPSAPYVHSLIESAVAGQEQERRRRELEVLTREVEDALNHDDHLKACQKADEGLARFPEDRILSKLKALAIRQRQFEERKLFVDRHVAEARELLQQGRNEELRKILEKAIEEIGAEPRIQSLLELVREKLQHERTEQRKAEGLQRTQQLLDGEDFDGALQLLEQLANEVGEDREVHELTVRARSRIQQIGEAARQEEIRKKEDALVLGLIARAHRAFDLNTRVQILQEAIRVHPRQIELQDELSAAEQLRNRVTILESEARDLEQSLRYDEALAKWEALGAAYSDYPNLDSILELARRRQQEAQEKARLSRIEKLQLALSSGEFEEAEVLLVQAMRDFRGDSELAELEGKVKEGFVNRTKAKKFLASAAKAIEKGQFEKALELFKGANAAANSDPVIREEVVSGLLSSATAVPESDCELSEAFTAEAARVAPDSPLLGPVRSIIEERRLRALVERRLSDVERCLSQGDCEGALRSVERGLSENPNEDRLLACKVRIEGIVRLRKEELLAKQLRESEARAKEIRDKELREAEQRRAREQALRLHEAERKEAEERQVEQTRKTEPSRHPATPRESAEPLVVSATGIFDLEPAPASPGISARPELLEIASGAEQNPLSASPASSLDSRLAQVMKSRSDAVEPTKGQIPLAAGSDHSQTASASTESEPNRTQPGVAKDELREASLPIIERQLAAFIGPLAKVLVKRAAGKAKNANELYTMLAEHLEREEDRRAFLSLRKDLSQDEVSMPSVQSMPSQAGPPPAATRDVPLPDQISPAAIELAARRLAVHLGPIATVLAKKEAKRAATRRDLYQRLADHLSDPADRKRFLKEAGAQ